LKLPTTYLYPLVDFFLIFFVYPSALILRFVRKFGIHKLPNCRSALLHVGVFPIRDHYYEPQFDFREPRKPFTVDRNLPGIDWNIEDQVNFLANLKYSSELKNIPSKQLRDLEFHFNNGNFESGDAEYWYQLVRHIRPRRIFEIGSGYSTLMAIKAIQMNQQEDQDYTCRHICIEPYEMPWLEKSNVEVVRQRIEYVDLDLFLNLEDRDILFIDSSHVIRPDGDVLLEYLEILPRLKVGVIVHIHDIFSPKNYLDSWLKEHVKFWNEQYLLEAFLTDNKNWKILGALNFLHHNQFEDLKRVSPYLTPEREPGSFYIQKIG
jgi:hypothetical protein